jgi:hypothetical protein
MCACTALLLVTLTWCPSFPMCSASFKKTFLDIKNFDEVWQFVRGPLYEGLYPNKWYNREPYAGAVLRTAAGSVCPGSLSLSLSLSIYLSISQPGGVTR